MLDENSIKYRKENGPAYWAGFNIGAKEYEKVTPRPYMEYIINQKNPYEHAGDKYDWFAFAHGMYDGYDEASETDITTNNL